MEPIILHREARAVMVIWIIATVVVLSQSSNEQTVERKPIYGTQHHVIMKMHSREKRGDFIFEEEDFNPNGGYGHWSKWSSCSRRCGPGERSRTRKCQDVSRCHDGNVELKFCFLRKC